jgi:3-oxoacyl-[acyl-carrier protein] reductase
MELGIKGKVALVTASSAGMGRNIALTLAAEGANIVLFARSVDALQSLAEDLKTRYSVEVLIVAGDMRVKEDVERLTLCVKEHFGGLDIFILNTPRAPNPLWATLDENEDARWHQAYENQLWSAIQVCKSVLPLMLNRGWGRIIAITSASVKEPMAHHSLSTVFRAGVSAYIKHLANEVGVHAITANCVAPALIDNSHRQGLAAYTQEQTNARLKLTPLARMGTQEEIAGVVTFLASRQAGFITGTSIVVDGGMSRSMH